MNPNKHNAGAKSYAVPPQRAQQRPRSADAACPPQGRLVVEVVEDASALARLQNTWDSLWAADASADLFSSFIWFSNLWEHFGQGGSPVTLVANQGETMMPLYGGRWQLNVCVVRDGAGSAIALLPLVRVQASFMRFRACVLATPVNSQSPRTGLIATRFDAEVVAALCAAMYADTRWDFLLLDGLRDGIGRFECLEQALRERHRLTTSSRGRWGHAYLNCGGGWPELLARKSQNFRRKLAKNKRSLAELGELKLECFVGEDAATVGLDTFVAVDRASWKAHDGEVIDQKPELRKYYQTLMDRLGPRGGAEVWVLRVAGELVAACICLNDGFSRYTLKASFSLAFGHSTRFSPSQLLIALIVEDTCSRPAMGVDFVSRINLADRWADEALDFGHVLFCRSRFTALAARLRHVVSHRIADHRLRRIAWA